MQTRCTIWSDELKEYHDLHQSKGRDEATMAGEDLTPFVQFCLYFRTYGIYVRIYVNKNFINIS